MNNTSKSPDDGQQITTIDLLRHGDCVGGRIFRGHTDSALSTLGWQQMHSALQLHPDNKTSKPINWQSIISSPLKRCSDFAQQLAEKEQLPLFINKGLQEISFGDWDGRLSDQVYQEQPQAVAAFWQNPAEHTPANGETLVDFQQRVQQAWQHIIQQQQGKHCLLISHGGVIRIILAHLLQMPLRPVSYLSVPHACLTQIKIFHQHGQPDWPQLIFHQPLASKQYE